MRGPQYVKRRILKLEMSGCGSERKRSATDHTLASVAAVLNQEARDAQSSDDISLVTP
jgi:hypothetical protein